MQMYQFTYGAISVQLFVRRTEQNVSKAKNSLMKNQDDMLNAGLWPLVVIVLEHCCKLVS